MLVCVHVSACAQVCVLKYVCALLQREHLCRTEEGLHVCGLFGKEGISLCASRRLNQGQGEEVTRCIGAQYESVFLVLMSSILFFSACVWVVTSLSLGMRRSLRRGDSDSNKKTKKRGRDGGRQEGREGSWTGRLVYAASELSPLWVCKFGLTGWDAGPHLT